MEGLACLQCGQPLESDFGIVACTNCGAVLMIDMDGQVQLAADNDKSAEPAKETPNAVPDAAEIEAAAYEDSLISPAEPASSFEAFADPKTEKNSLEEPSSGFDENSGEDQFANQDHSSNDQAEEPLGLGENEVSSEESSGDALLSEAPTEETPVEGSPVEAAPNEDNANWFDQGLDQPPPETEQVIEPIAGGDFSDVSDFGNQDVDAGALQFDLTLSGIDHKEMRAEVMDVLADPRLYLNLRDLPVKNGTIVLPGLNAARTSLIVTRLQHLNLRINWKQRLYEA